MTKRGPEVVMVPWVAPQLEERARRPWRDVPAVDENGARPGARPLVATVRAAADAATTGGVGRRAPTPHHQRHPPREHELAEAAKIM